MWGWIHECLFKLSKKLLNIYNKLLTYIHSIFRLLTGRLPGPRLGTRAARSQFIRCGRRPRSVAPRAPRALATLIPVAALPFLREGALLFPKPLEMVLERLFHVLNGVNGSKSSSVQHHAAGQVSFCDSFSATCFRPKDHANSVS